MIHGRLETTHEGAAIKTNIILRENGKNTFQSNSYNLMPGTIYLFDMLVLPTYMWSPKPNGNGHKILGLF